MPRSSGNPNMSSKVDASGSSSMGDVHQWFRSGDANWGQQVRLRRASRIVVDVPAEWAFLASYAVSRVDVHAGPQARRGHYTRQALHQRAWSQSDRRRRQGVDFKVLVVRQP
eukprot:6006350-Pleurochrysis_carterae.AAC.2